jgi:arsenite-transporting ATPase
VIGVARSGAAFSQLAEGKERRYFLLGGKGGVGKTSLSASLGVKLAAAGHYTLVVSTDPAHSLSDSLAQSVAGGSPVEVAGTDGRLFGLEVDPEEAKKDFAAFAALLDGGGDSGKADANPLAALMGGMGGLGDLKLGELLETPPPGLDEIMAIVKVVAFIEEPQFAHFTRIVFDTAPTGHTLRMLSLPEFMDKALGKMVRLKQKLSGAANKMKTMFVPKGQPPPPEAPDEAVVRMEGMKRGLRKVKALFHNRKATEFIIATIPTVLSISESSRLLASLRAEKVPVRRLVVNQVYTRPASKELDIAGLRAELEAQRNALTAAAAGDAALTAAADALASAAGRLADAAAADATFVAAKRRDQEGALKQVAEDAAGLGSLRLVLGPLMEQEVRGVSSLAQFGEVVWTD